MAIKDNIKMLRDKYGITQKDLADIAGVTDKAVSTWENGVNEPRMGAVQKIADHFGIKKSNIIEDHGMDDISIFNILPLPKTYKVPLVGNIACGEPILAIEDAEKVIDVPEWIHADFALLCKGDSMITARIFDGDVVFIHRQPEVENGQIAAVRIENEATLKKVYYTPGSNRIVLRACNPLYPDMVYADEALDQIEILGLAVGFFSKIRHEQ